MLHRLSRALRSFSIEQTRNIDSGKTTFSERVLFYTGKIKSIHEVRGADAVGAKMDSMELEREKGITIQSAATYCKWKDWNINLIDTPGHVDFTIEVERALRVLDGAVLLVCGASGVQSQTLTVNRQMRRYNVPRIIFINKLDRPGANPRMTIKAIQDKIEKTALPIQIPIGLIEKFQGLIDIVEQKAYYFEGQWGEQIVQADIPDDYLERVAQKREELFEGLSDLDDQFAELFLSGEEISTDIIKSTIRKATIARKFSPILLGSAYKNKGVQLALDAVGDYLPSPDEVENFALDLDQNEQKVWLKPTPKQPMVALAFKLEENRFGQLTFMRMYQGRLKKGEYIYNSRTQSRVKVSRMVKIHSNELVEIQEVGPGEIFALFGIECNSGDTFTDGKVKYSMTSMYVPDPVMQLSITPTKKEQLNNFNKAINRFIREDPTFRYHVDEESNETIISGMGELHLQIYAERMRREYNVDVQLGPPAVNYRETITARNDFNYLHKKQTGGAGQYAGVQGYIEPIPDIPIDAMEPSRFIDKTVGTNISPEFKAAIEKGFKLCVQKGPQVGYPVVNMQYVLTDGQTHVVDSSSNAFITATKASFVQALPGAKPVILEPIMLVECTVPGESQTGVVGGIVRRRGMIRNSVAREDGTFVIEAEAPLAQMFGYSSELRSSTQGQGEFSMEFLRYEPVNDGDAELLRQAYSEKMKKERAEGSDF